MTTFPQAPPARRDWLDTVRDASDLALLGVLVIVGSLGVVTLGAAMTAGSAAVHEWLRTNQMPPLRTSLRRYLRALLPGCAGTVTVLLLCGLLAINASAVSRGVVPGGPPLAFATVVVAVLLAGFLGLAVVAAGRGDGFRDALGLAWRTSVNRPLVPLALGGIVAVAVLLCLVLPIGTPVVAGFGLFGLHVLARRFAL